MVPVIRTEACNLEEWLCASGTTGLKSAAPCRQDCLREVQMLITLALGPASLALAPRRPAGRRQPRCPRAVSWPSGLPRAPPTHGSLGCGAHYLAVQQLFPFPACTVGTPVPSVQPPLTHSQRVGRPGTCPPCDGRAACGLGPGTWKSAGAGLLPACEPSPPVCPETCYKSAHVSKAPRGF